MAFPEYRRLPSLAMSKSRGASHLYNPDKSFRRIYQPRSQNVCSIKRVFGYKINSRFTRSCVVLKRILRVLKMDSLGAVAYNQEVQYLTTNSLHVSYLTKHIRLYY